MEPYNQLMEAARRYEDAVRELRRLRGELTELKEKVASKASALELAGVEVVEAERQLRAIAGER